MKVSVVIVNYNVCDLLLACIESLQIALQDIEAELIVVDNASTDGAIEALARHYPAVMTIPLERNVGFGAANNIGIERAGGEYILLLNPDTIVQEDTIRTMIAFMEAHPDAIFAGCRIILPDGTLDPVSKRGFPSPWSSFCRVFGLSRLFPQSRLFGGYNLTYLPDDATSEVDALAGCFMFCRAEGLKKLGGFDADFFMYGEDLDLCFRARRQGGAIYYHPETSIMHLKGESTRRSSIDALALFYEAMEIFARKHFRRNPLLLWSVRLGISIRRGIARLSEQFPSAWIAVVDIVAALIGFVAGSIMKFGTPFNYPEWSLPVVWGVPPCIFVMTIALAGGYRGDDGSPTKSLLGVLIGFLLLSTLPYFFKEYAFSRGVVLVTTVVAGAIAVVTRFVHVLWRRTFGPESIRRVAILSRGEVVEGVRRGIRRLFPTRPVTIVGTIAPTIGEMQHSNRDVLGSIDNIFPIARDHRLTDIVVLDAGLGYSEVLRAMELTRAKSVRFHILHGQANTLLDVPAPSRTMVMHRAMSSRWSVRVRDRLVALFVIAVFWPAVYWKARNPRHAFKELWDVLMGRRPLVGSGGVAPRPMFAMSTLVGNGALSAAELSALEASYRTRHSMLLDAEIVIGVLRGHSLLSAARCEGGEDGVEEPGVIGRIG